MPIVKKERIFVLLAAGFEETDVSTIIRTLRRAGFPVAVVGLTAGPIRGNHGLLLEPDVLLSETEAACPQAVILPGGLQGARHLSVEPRVHALLRQVINQGGYIVALEAAYTVLRSSGVLDETEGWPALAPLCDWNEGRDPSRRVSVEGPVILGRDLGAAQETMLTLISLMEQKRAGARRW